MKDKYSFEEFIDIIETLLGENGCPWDREQTHQSLKRNMIEESYEVIDAIDKGDTPNLCEELGDVLLQVAFHSELAKKENSFNIDDVITGISQKMILRHPHVFSDAKVETSDEVLKNWDEIKKIEKGYSSITDTLKSIPKAFPALFRATKVQEKAAKVGFDFENISQAQAKVYEELDELKDAYESGNKGNILDEFGDILFSLVNISRFLNINPEFALTNATEKFINRFEYIEMQASKRNLTLEDMTLEQMDNLWNEAKKVFNHKMVENKNN